MLVVLLYSSGIVGAGETSPSSVKDLQYGEMLFYYFQKDYFNSIVRLEMAQEQERLPNHKYEAELMLGGLVLSYGMRDEARQIFQQLLDDKDNNLSVHNRAWLYLAKISHQRGDLQGALDAIANISDEMTPSTRTATANLKSLLLLAAGRNAEAIEVLENTRSGKSWTPYLQYNLGVAQIRNGQDREGEENLDNVRTTRGRTTERLVLRDKANLALGYKFLQQGEPEKSRLALEKVHLQGPLSNKALLGTGWADADAGKYARALVPWTELSTRNATDPAVQESMLAVPYAMAKMELYGQAVQQYKQSIATLNHEKKQLDRSIYAIQEGELLKYLEQNDRGATYGWLQQLELDTDSPALRYQIELISSHDFQEGIKNYRDLLSLSRNLDGWESSIAAYDDMLATRESRYQSHMPAVEHVLKADTLGILEQRYTALEDSIADIEKSGNSIGFSNETETRHLHALANAEKQLAAMPDTPEINDLRSKQQFLYGVLSWQTDSQYKQRLRQKKKQLEELEALIRKTGNAIDNLKQSDIETPAGFAGFDKRISKQKDAIVQLQARTSEAFRAQGILLQQLAINELQAQKARIDTYIVQARFALAQTYDNSLNKGTGGVAQ